MGRKGAEGLSHKPRTYTPRTACKDHLQKSPECIAGAKTSSTKFHCLKLKCVILVTAFCTRLDSETSINPSPYVELLLLS
ncbi:hypothetical protein FKM82_006240 [Ascaphus truei]